MSHIKIRPYTTLDHAWLVEQHQKLYAENDGFDDSFGPLIDRILTNFEASADTKNEQGWIAEGTKQRLGSIFCVRVDDQTAKLRLFLLIPEARGKGLGMQLLTQCMDFAKRRGYARMSLWTHESHTAACALYSKTGWSCVSSKQVQSFGVSLIEQQWEITL